MPGLLPPRLLISSGVFIAALFGVSLYFENTVTAKGPELSGVVKTFQLATSLPPRPSPTDRANWKDGNGKTLTLADFKGKVVLLNYWATWCSPCIRELPSIDRLQARLGGKAFTIVAISIDRSGKPTVQRMIERLKIKNLAIYLDQESKAARKMGVRSMPTTFLFDSTGREVGKMVGAAEWDQQEAVSLIKYFIDNPDYADRLPVKE